MKPCQQCHKRTAIMGEKYCQPCKTTVIDKAMKAGKIRTEGYYTHHTDETGRHSRIDARKIEFLPKENDDD